MYIYICIYIYIHTYIIIYIYLVWVKQCHKPAMTGNGNHTTYKNGDDWGGWWQMALFYPHYK